MKVLILLVLYTALYAVNCEYFNHEIDRIFKDDNKVLIVVSQQEKIIIFNEEGIYGLMFNSRHITQYFTCDSNNDSIIFNNIEGKHYYSVYLSEETILFVKDFFGNQDFINFKFINPISSKLNYIIKYENSFITAFSQLLTTQSSATINDLDFLLEFIKEKELEEFSGKNKRIREGGSPDISPKRHAGSAIAEMISAHSTIPSQSQTVQTSTHNDPIYTLSSIGTMQQQVVSETYKPILGEGNADDLPMIQGTNETASSGIDKTDEKTPKFVLNDIYREQLPPHIIELFERRKFFSKDYGIIFRIPPKYEISMTQISLVNTLNSYLSDLKPNQNIVLVSKNWINGQIISINSFIYLVINKIDLLTYRLEVYYTSSNNVFFSNNLRFAFNNLELKDFIILRHNSSFKNISDYYVLAELGNNTDDQLTSLPFTGNKDGYKSIEELLYKLFMGNNYYSDEITMKDKITKLPELISRSKTNERFIFVGKKYYQKYNIDKRENGNKIGIILEPINSYSFHGNRLYKVSYILVEFINSEYRFLINELKDRGSVLFEKSKGSSSIMLRYYSGFSGKKSALSINGFKLIREKM